MVLPLLIPLAIGAVAGWGSSKGTAKVREFLCEGEEIFATCPNPNCKDEGPHLFCYIDKSNTAGVITGVATGGIGGVVAGALAKKVYQCRKCGCEMFENGLPRKSNWDDNVKQAVVHGTNPNREKEMKENLCHLEEMNLKYGLDIEVLKKNIEKLKSVNKNNEDFWKTVIALHAIGYAAGRCNGNISLKQEKIISRYAAGVSYDVIDDSHPAKQTIHQIKMELRLFPIAILQVKKTPMETWDAFNDLVYLVTSCEGGPDEKELAFRQKWDQFFQKRNAA